MSLTKWNPFKEMENFFEHHPSELTRARGEAARMFDSWTPIVDINETPKEFVITTELPGVRKKDINVEIDHGVLTISGERKFEEKDDENKHHRIERFYGNFSRSFTLPDSINQEKVKAEFKKGLLTIELFKTEVPKPKAVQVDVAGE